MRAILTFCLACCLSGLFAGGFTFPNVPYSYARVYLYNVEYESAKGRPDFAIYRDGQYALSKIGNGWDVPAEMVKEMNAVFRPGVDMMVEGLSKCFTPRHGIIYFDSAGNPVASLSICFECQQIYFWSSVELEPFKEAEHFSKKGVEQAEKQFEDLEACMKRFDIPVFEETSKYLAYKSDLSEALFKSEGEIIIEDPDHSVFGIRQITREIAVKWLRGPASDWVESVRNQTDTRQTDGVEQRDFVELTYKKSSVKSSILIFSKGENLLGEAYIKSPEIVLPNGATVGMSTEQIQALCGVYDGLAYPGSIIINYSDATLRYTFENRTLWMIVLVVK